MSAAEIKVHTSWLNFRKDTDKMGAFYRRKPSGVNAILALAAGTRHRQWRLAMVCCEVLGNAESHQAQAVPSLYEALQHSESSVRSAAVEALGKLADSTSVSARKLWDFLLKERDPLTADRAAQALTAALPSDFSEEQTRKLLTLLQRGFQNSRATLPLASGGKETVLEPGERESELRDVYGIFTQLLAALGKAPGLKHERFDFLLSILPIWILCREYNGQRVRALLALVENDEDRGRLLATAGQTGGQYAFRGPEFELMTMRPEWAGEILRNRLARDCPWDWTNWRYRLGGFSSEHLSPVIELFQQVKGEARATLFKLLGEAPVEPQLPGLGVCLESSDDALVKATLERLKTYSQPVPQLLDKLSRVKQLSEEPEVKGLCDAVIGQSGGLPGTRDDGEAPRGKAPDIQIEVQLEETYRTPFGPEQKPWRDSLRRCSVHYLGNQVAVQTPTRLHCFELDQEGRVTSRCELTLPVEGGFSAVSFYRPGAGSDLFLSHAGPSRTTLYLFRDGRLRLLKPEIGNDYVPRAHDQALLWNGANYGWNFQAWIMSHFEADPGHHERAAYTVDPRKETVEERFDVGADWRPVERQCLSARFGTTFRMVQRKELEFCYTPDGRYRRSNIRELLLPRDEANPIDSGTDYDEGAALLIDVFPDRTLRVSVWCR